MTGFYPLLTILYAPKKAFGLLSESTRHVWLAPFVLCAFLSVLVAWGMGPITQTIIANNLPAGVELTQKAIPGPASPFIAPLGVLVRFILQAGFLWACIYLINTPMSFSRVLAVVGYSSIVVAIGELMSVGLLYYRGYNQLTDPLSVYGDFGLYQLFPGSYGMAVESILRSISVFSVWYLVLLTVGLVILGKMRSVRAFLVSFIVWVFPVLLGATALSFFDKIRSLTP